MKNERIRLPGRTRRAACRRDAAPHPDHGHRASSGGQGRANTTFENIHGKVDWQVGVLNGDVQNYEVNSAAPPGERFEKAVKLLDGNMARRAEELRERIRTELWDGARGVFANRLRSGAFVAR